MVKCAGILTAGGDSPGLNAAIRSAVKILLRHNCRTIGYMDGFEGIAFDRTMDLTEKVCSGILTAGGTILHTSRNKPNKMPVGDKLVDMTGAIVENYRKRQLDALICIGGGGTHKSALALAKAGLNIITMPKTIDNDLWGTDDCIGFNTALGVATTAIDNLHSTASSHKRVMLVEIMGHKAGWLALGSGIAGGADVILLPEIPYSTGKVAETLLRRAREGKLFSIVPVAEGALSRENAAKVKELEKLRASAGSKSEKEEIKRKIEEISGINPHRIFELSRTLEKMTNLETRVTILGHLQRGGTPSESDRLLATRLGAAAADCVLKGKFGVMTAIRGGEIQLVPLDEVAGKRKCVPLNHSWMKVARELGVCFGEE